MSMRRLIPILVLTLAALLASPRPSFAEPLTPVDHDLQLVDTHFGLHLGGNITNGAFGAVSLGFGIYNFGLMGAGQATSQTFFLALYMTSLGAAGLISAATTTDSNVKMWKALKGGFAGASPAERRLLRQTAAARLRQVAVNRAIGLAADGTFLGIGVALALASPSPLGALMIVNGAFILGVDIFKLAVDDQTAAAWERNDDKADEGYFSARRRRPRVLGWAASPLVHPDGQGGAAAGFAFGLRGVF
jgi:hypothetical protein